MDLRRRTGRSTAASSSSGSARSARPWLGDFTWALPSIGAIGTWVTFGLCMVLFVAGVQKIPLDALRRGARRRRRRRPRVLRRHAAGPAQRDPRRVRADDDQRAPQLRHRLQHDGRRAGGHDDRPLDVHVPERVSVQPRRVRRRDRDDPRDRRSSSSRRSCSASATGARSDERDAARSGSGRTSCSARSRCIAIYPVLSILFLALHRRTTS